MSDKVLINKSTLSSIADAIREKTETTSKLKPSEFSYKIKEMSESFASQQWRWALNNVINFSSNNSAFFKGNTYLKIMPDYFNEECKKVTNWSNAFSGCTKLTEINIDMSAGTNFNSTFKNCNSLTNIGIKNLNFNKIINGFAMFGYGTKITNLPNFNHNTITNMGEMFWSCSLSDLGTEDLNFPNVTNAEWVFGETQIAKVPNLSFPNATSVKGIFRDCKKLISVANFNIPNATNVAEAFKGCSSLKEIGNIDINNVTNTGNLFSDCTSLERIEIVPDTIKINISFANSPLLTDETIQNIINGLAVVATQRTLTLHADVKAKLTEEQINLITSKNWKIV
nr:MAG TPA: protein of unknown function DUF285 [Caudoviricetes sp.]